MINETIPDALLEQYARLPEPYQPIWGVEQSRELARRACDDRVATMLPVIESLSSDAPLRILDIGCAQGYFSFALRQRFSELGRDVEIIGVDYLIDNVDFCKQVAAHQQLDVRFIHDRFDEAFFDRHDLGQFDAVLALNVLHHIRALNGEDAASGALKAIQSHSCVLVCEIAQSREALDWVGSSWHSSDDELLHGYPFRRKLAEFSTHLTDVRRPLYVCSESKAWVANQWFEYSHAIDRSHPGVSEDFAGQRSFFFGDGIIIKSYRGEGRYGEFNREELQFERDALSALNGEPDRFPALLVSEDSGECLWLVRQTLPGNLLSGILTSDEPLDADGVVLGLLQELAHLEEKGFHHADIRCWNVLWFNGLVRLIDFGSIRKETSPLHRVSLAAVLLEIAGRRVRNVEPFYKSLQPLDAYPPSWRPLVRLLVTRPQKEFTYAEAVKVFQDRFVSPESSVADDWYPSSEILVALTDEQCSAFVELNAHAQESARNYERVARHADALTEEIAKVNANVASERDSVKNAMAEAEAYSRSLVRELDLARQRANVAEEYASSLSERLGEMRRAETEARRVQQAEADRQMAQNHQFELQVRELEAQAQRHQVELLALGLQIQESEALSQRREAELVAQRAEIQRLEITLAALRRRFQIFKFFWPRITKD